MERLRLELAGRAGERVCREAQVSVLPVDPEEIATAHDISVHSDLEALGQPLNEGLTGCFMEVENGFGILYGTGLPNQGFINFTIAHELGHYFLDGHCEHVLDASGQHESRSGFVSADLVEQEADSFAAGLLMPEYLLRPAMRLAGVGFSAIERLAAQCGTSITATAIRFAHLAEDPVAVVMSRDGRIEYSFVSGALQELRGLRWSLKGQAVPQRSGTWSVANDPRGIAEGRRLSGSCDLTEWFDAAPMVEVEEDVVGLGSYGRVLTVLFAPDGLLNDDEDEW